MMIGGDRNVVERRQARRLTSRRAWILAVSARNTTAEPVLFQKDKSNFSRPAWAKMGIISKEKA